MSGERLSKTIHLPGYSLRLSWTPTDDGRVTWVDYLLVVQIDESFPEDPTNGPLFHRSVPIADDRGCMDHSTTAFDEAEVLVEGMIKWDACMQFDVKGAHEDSLFVLRRLFAAIEETRRLASELMGDAWDSPEDYPLYQRTPVAASASAGERTTTSEPRGPR